MRVIFTTTSTIVKIFFAILLFLIPLMEGQSQTENYTWGNVALGGGGFVTGIVGHKTSGDVYCRTDVGGAYRWDAPKDKWVPLLDWCSEDEVSYQGVEAIALDPKDPNKVYMLVGTSYFNNGKTAILRSSDKGNTFSITDVSSSFKAHGNGIGRGTGERLAVDPNNGNILYCGTRRDGLWKSTDAGATWTLAWDGVTATPSDNGICFVIFDPNSVSGGITQTIYLGVSRLGSTNVYRSTDGGKTFSALSAALPTAFMPNRAVLSGNTLYIAYADGSGPHGHWSEPEPATNGQVWKYNTSTSTATDITPLAGKAYAGVSVDPGNSNRLIVSTTNSYTNNQFNTTWGDYIYLSTDGGNTWTLKISNTSTFNTNGVGWMAANSGIHWDVSIEFDPLNAAKVRVTSGNGLFTCDNINATNTVWKVDVKGMEETVVLDAISIPNGKFISAVGDQYGAVYSDVYAYPAKNINPTKVSNNGLAYASNNTNKVARVSDKVYYSTDQGTTWTQLTSIEGSYGKVALSADGNTMLLCPGGESTTYYSTDNGGTWTSTGVTDAKDAFPIADFVNTNKFYIYNRSTGQLLVSTNKGVSFSASASNPGQWGASRARAVPGNEGHVWVALNGGGLKYTANNGTSWTTIANVTDCAAVGFGKAAPGTTYPAIYIWGTIGGVKGIYRSTDKGVKWIRINDDAHEWGGPGNGNFVMGDMNVYGRVYMSTVGRGLIAGEAPKYTLNTTSLPSVGGTVSGGGSHTSGSIVTVTATPATGYTFTGWTGDATGSSTSVTVTMNGNKSVTANFEAIKYTLTATASPTAGGTVSGGGSYTYGSTATLTATPATGYTFTGWSGDATGTGTTTSVTMNGNKSVTATFEVIQPDKYTLVTAVLPAAGGTVSGGGSYTSGATATLIATPASGYTFTGWSGDVTGTSATVTVTMTGNKTVTANFQLQKYTLTATASPLAGGSVNGAGSYDAGSVATLTATPAEGYTFTGWSGDVTGTSPSITVTMNGNKNVTANFQSQSNTTKYTLTTTASPSAGGSVSGGGSYDAGSVATLTATPASGYTFTGWSGDVTGTEASVTLTMDGNKTVIANFSITSFTLSATVVPTAGGSVTGTGTYASGTVVTIEAVAASGYIFSGWSGDIAGTAASQSVTLNSDVAVQANFQVINETALKIPKLFSPDNRGDMSTELWNIENAYLLDGCEIVIYNRQGQKVYSCTGYATPWDGTSNGKPLPDGAYFYIIRHPDNSKQTGSVTIARLK